MNKHKKKKNWGNFYKKYKMLGGFHKIKDQMLVSMTHQAFYIPYKNSPNFLLNMFHLEPTPLSLNKNE